MKKLAPFNNHSYAIKRETCEIITDPDSCNLMEHAQLYPSWMKVLESRCWSEASNNVKQNVADEGGGDPSKVLQQQKGLKGFYLTLY